MKIIVVIPAYKVSLLIQDVISSIPATVSHIIVVDDACPEHSGHAAERTGDQRLVALYNEHNLGVGGAVVAGYKKALELDADIVIKIDGDGQMDPGYIPELIAPLAAGEADYTKGNRFMDFSALRAMPRLRLFGNSMLSFLLKIASGYWNIVDPTNGYTAIHRRALEKLELHRLAKRYFFESDMLINLNIINAVVKDIAIPARYGPEESSLRIGEIMSQFPFRLLEGFTRRVLLKYYVYDFNMASIYILVGLPMFLFGVIFGMAEWLDSYMNGAAKTAGTIMLVALPIIVSFQMLLQAVSIDISSVPGKNR